MRSCIRSNSPNKRRSALRSFLRLLVLASTSIFVGYAIGATAQTVEGRHWQGSNAVTRQPEQVVAMTLAEWRSLWSRVGVHAPDFFEPGRMSAIGIFLGTRAGTGHTVNVLSTSRRRDRIIVVFEERGPVEFMMAQRASPAPSPRNISGGPSMAPSLAPMGGSNFAPPGAPMGNLAPLPARPAAPTVPLTSPWAIVLLHRADLPVTVEQRWFR